MDTTVDTEGCNGTRDICHFVDTGTIFSWHQKCTNSRFFDTKKHKIQDFHTKTHSFTFFDTRLKIWHWHCRWCRGQISGMCNGEVKCKIKRRQKRGWSGKAWSAWWPLGKDWPVSRFLPISRFQPGGFLPKLTLNDTEIMRGSHFPPSIPPSRPHRATLGIDCPNHHIHHLNQHHVALDLFRYATKFAKHTWMGI